MYEHWSGWEKQQLSTSTVFARIHHFHCRNVDVNLGLCECLCVCVCASVVCICDAVKPTGGHHQQGVID